MSQNLPSIATPPTPPPAELVERARRYLAQTGCLPPRLASSAVSRSSDRWEILGGLTEEERRALKAREAALTVMTSRSDPEAVSAALAPLWVAFPAAGGGSSDGVAEARVLVYAKALDGIPAWAVGEAVMAFLRGEVERQAHMFAPTAPELRLEARRRMKPLEESRHETHMLLQAAPRAVVTAEEAERRRQRVAEIMGRVRLGDDAR